MLDDYRSRLWSRMKSKHLADVISVYGQNRNGEAVTAQFRSNHSAFSYVRYADCASIWGIQPPHSGVPCTGTF